MLFQGEEFAASAPFFYFADHNPELAKLVAKGRKEFLHQFKTAACPEAGPYIKEPGAEETFLACKLDRSERKQNAETLTLYRDLLRLRREDPVFSKPQKGRVDGAVLGTHAFVLRFFGEKNNDRLLIVNLGPDLHLEPWPEPLLAPLENSKWTLEWSSESPCYGGSGTPAFDEEGNWLIPGKCALVLAAEALSNINGKNRSKDKSRPSQR
jgi:maltooligosyltrehalose trehalohydrolase